MSQDRPDHGRRAGLVTVSRIVVRGSEAGEDRALSSLARWVSSVRTDGPLAAQRPFVVDPPR